jgi:hypothetical protein
MNAVRALSSCSGESEISGRAEEERRDPGRVGKFVANFRQDSSRRASLERYGWPGERAGGETKQTYVVTMIREKRQRKVARRRALRGRKMSVRERKRDWWEGAVP